MESGQGKWKKGNGMKKRKTGNVKRIREREKGKEGNGKREIER